MPYYHALSYSCGPSDFPGDLGFDPLKFSKGKSDAQIADLQLKEVKNGRVAMVGFMGMLAQNLVTHGAPTL